EEAFDAQIRAGEVSHGGGRFERVALFPVRGKKREAEIGMRKRVALKNAAHADRFARFDQLDEIEAEPEARVAGNRAVCNVPARVLERTHTAVADVLDERRLVEQRQDEGRVFRREVAQPQTRRVECHPLRMPKRDAVSPSKSTSISTAGS